MAGIQFGVTGANGVTVSGVTKLRLDKIAKPENGDMASSRVLHVETEVGDFRIKLEATGPNALAIEVLNPITAV